jgi:hypothetical protein
MTAQPLALTQLQALLGRGATDDTLWADLRRFERVALPIITAAWQLDQIEDSAFWPLLHPHTDAARELHRQRCATAVQQLQAALRNDAGRCAATFLLHPQLWQAAYIAGQHYYGYAHTRSHVHAGLLTTVAEACVLQQPPHDWPRRLARRMLTLCSANSCGNTPDLAACVGYLLACDTATVAPLLDALTLGDWAAAWRSAAALAAETPPQAAERLRERWQERGAQHALALLARLFHSGRLNAPAFRRLLEALPGSLRNLNSALAHWAAAPPTDPGQQAFAVAVQRLTDTVLWELLCDFRPESWPTLVYIGYLSGGRYLLRLAEETDRQGLAQLRASGYVHQHAGAVLVQLLGVLRRRPDDDSMALTALLRQVGVPALLALLPHVPPYEAEICAALGWEGSAALVALLRRLEAANPARSADPTAGVVRRQELLDTAAALDTEHLRALLDAFAPHTHAAVTLLRAALGWNRAEVRRQLGRRNQLAARALALLPLERPDELLQRYLLLTRYEREANSSRAGRKAFERAAAQSGLANLALHAGYPDATRLEWAMEDRLGAQTVSLGRQWSIEGYTLTLALRDGEPVITVHNGTRALKRTPALVSRDYAYREVRATLEQAQDQARRYRQAFLAAMRRDQPLTAEEIALLRRNPLAAQALEQLVLIDEAGGCGLFRADDGALEGTHGERVAITGAVRIAHPYTLQQLGLLNDWQAEIVRRQIVQPFKQLFREIYLLTPAEHEARYTSARFAGRRMRGRQAVAVLANLGWLVDGYGSVYKPLYELGYAAHFETGSYGYGHDGEDDAATTGTLTFWPLAGGYGTAGQRRMPLDQVPPLILSELLRDLDLVTVIAHQGEEQGASREVLRQRGDLARATANSLGLTQVRVEEPFVYVSGSLTSYRIHLATAAIYMASGQYLCIVPRPQERKAIYLPFAEGGDPVSSEVISKMLLLSHDTAISDGTILAQIVSATTPAL